MSKSSKFVLQIKRSTLYRYAQIESYSQEGKKNQKLKKYFNKIKKLGHIKNVPDIRGNSDKTYKVYMRNVYRERQ